MTRRMADSTNIDDIPTGVFQLIGYYVDASFAASPAQIARHAAAGSVMVPITVGANPTNGRVADVENGDYLPWESVDFVVAKRAEGVDPSVYVSYDLWSATQTEFRIRGVPEPHWWIALWDGSALLIPGAVAKQFADPPLIAGNPHYDESIVEDFWPGIDGTFGPGGGTLGGDELTPEEAALLQTAATYANIAVKFLEGETVTYTQPDGTVVTRNLLNDILAAIKAGSGTEPVEPRTISFTGTGTLS